MTDEERAYRKAELRSILLSIPLKAIAAALLFYFMTSSDTPLFDRVIQYIMIYSVLSIYVFVSKRVGNWFVGFIAIVIGLIMFAYMDFPPIVYKIAEILFVGGGFTVDVIRIIRYIGLSAGEKHEDKTEPTNAAAEPTSAGEPF